MVDPKTYLNIGILEHTIANWINQTPLHLPAPGAALLHKLAQWAKVWAIYISHDDPVPAGIDVAATDYVGEHYALMLPIRGALATETDETCFNLAVGAGLKIFAGTAPQQAIGDILASFAANGSAFRRVAGSAPCEPWQHYWEMYQFFLN